MQSLDSGRYALTISVAAAMLAGCGGSQLPIGAPGAMSQSRAIAARSDSTSYTIVYSFGVSPDASNPAASLIDVGGTLYGTSVFGGSDSRPKGRAVRHHIQRRGLRMLI